MKWLHAISALLLALGAGQSFLPQHYKEIFSSMVPDVVRERFTTSFMNRVSGGILTLIGGTASEKFKGRIPWDESFEGFSTDVTNKEIYKNIRKHHICQVLGNVQEDKFDETIENIGDITGLPEKQIKKMKLSKYSEETSFSLTHFDYGSNGMYVYAKYESSRNINGGMDILLALFKVSWSLPGSIEKIDSSFKEEWSHLHDGTVGMTPDQGKEVYDQFIEVIQKKEREEAVSLQETQAMEMHFRQLAGQMNKDECNPTLLKESKKAMNT